MVDETLGHYRILSRLGQGGMGEVYLAQDGKLDRKVALKVLPPTMAENPDRLARFEREAKTIASLNHPNIVTIFSVEEQSGVHFLTMELVEGQTLTEMIPDGGMPLGALLDVAIPLTDALATAHDNGITHRDLKPDNIMLGDDGRLRILDFGLAKHTVVQVSESDETELADDSVTREGQILGTKPYMSPEQAAAEELDHRSDIFSLGIVLYEAATGERPFKGDSPMSLLSAIIKDEPQPVTSLNPKLPRPFARVIRRCLAKPQDRRYQSTADLRNELMDLRHELESGELEAVEIATQPAPAPARPSRRPWAVAGVLAVLVVALAILQLAPGERSGPGKKIGPGAVTMSRLTDFEGLEMAPSLSPDGKQVVYTGGNVGESNPDIFLLRVGGGNPINLTPDSPVLDIQPVFSPDGERIAFRSDRQGGGLFVMGATGESIRRVTDFGYHPAWSPDGTEIAACTESIVDPLIRASNSSRIWIVDVGSGERRLFFDGDGVQPDWSPDGSRIAYWSVTGGQRDVYTAAVEDGSPLAVTDDAFNDWNPRWSPDGRFLYFASDRGGSMNLWRVPIDQRSGRTRGEPEPVTFGAVDAGNPTISADGSRIAYVSFSWKDMLHRVAFDPAREAVTGPSTPVLLSPTPMPTVDVSADGRLAYWTSGTRNELHAVRNDGGDRMRLTDDAFKNRGPRWSPDGTRIAFYADRTGSYQVWTIQADGSGLEQVSDFAGQNVGAPVWSPDGTRLAAPAYETLEVVIFDMQAPGYPVIERLPGPEDPQGTTLPMDWSSDGRKLAGGIRRDGVEIAIFVYDLDTREYRTLPHRSRQITGSGVLWLSDDRRLLFSDVGDLFILDSETMEVRTVDWPDSLPRGVFGTISPDDRTLYYREPRIEADLWLIDGVAESR
jgi:serine/threonine protein kinase/sugar lactone lactonase YvrE